MSNLFFTSDTHFGHQNIIKYSNRPYADVEEMNEALLKNWNKVVKPGDTVWHLGDFAFTPYDQFVRFIQRLNGQIHCILGNHDKMISQNRKSLLAGNKIRSIQDYKKLKADGETLILFHYGMRVWEKSHYGSIMLYGHSHGSLPPFGKSVDVGVDCKEITSEYRPVSLDEVKKYMANRTFQAVDHHVMDE